jgi:hypothetical protein
MKQQTFVSITRDAVGLGPPAPVPQVKFLLFRNFRAPRRFLHVKGSPFFFRGQKSSRRTGPPGHGMVRITHRIDLMILGFFLIFWGHLLEPPSPPTFLAFLESDEFVFRERRSWSF